MKIAVTGASGFLGRHVLAALSREGVGEVVAVSRAPHASHAGAVGVRQVALDIESPPPDAWERLGRPDVLIHLAWSGLPNYGSLHHFESHLPRQYAFLRAQVQAGLSSIVCAGTCFEYGARDGELEEGMPADPRNPYAFAKDALRRQLVFLRETCPFRFTWARLFYMFGDGQPERSLYGQFRAAVARGERAFPMSPGDQLRDYLPVEEVARMLVQLALRRADAGIVNVCSGDPVSVRDLVQGWISREGLDMDLVCGAFGYSVHEPKHFWGNPAKLQRALELPHA